MSHSDAAIPSTTDDSRASKRRQILAAAAELFAQQGYDGTSIGAVAEAAKVQKSLVQYHFENKKSLWQESIRYIWQERDDALPRYLDENDSSVEPDELIWQLCRRVLRFTFDHPQWVKLMFQEASTPGPRLDWMVAHFFRSDFQRGTAIIELGQQQGLLPKGNVIDLLHILSGALIYLVNVAPITERVLGVSPESDEYIDHHVRSLMALLQTATASATKP
ncbi:MULTISPECIES: TetR/AcrR family transcriptional regulator [Spongiibacter]|jgi:TetR/AcrR family transcriptional regulator|uniref:TetR/AcrR family transcriptional regulator n=1 Tax=Spongiibacter TaxID=630749 RepID=UPI0003B41E9D|nr:MULTISPECIES: TetR/AcrR family transcriptional regulator [Spongiibacter]MAY39243.1 TetR/AcrR family transcriptional regulator [Spongiibacter sp.]MBI57570.1 TetR/AcrR family transcriptional regulator [Spongiibacter sp.]MBO6752534.1 TetR/AcrR family transcriptional regulator [Spongiibacter sp.]|tara:strand:- start:47452 stop:48111 length:660 start_codon:yes stop_codon:yes gene_type:complete